MIRIVHVESPNQGRQGDHIYRTLQPCRALGQIDGVEVISGSLLSPDIHRLLPGADIAVLCDVVDVDLLALVQRRNEAGRFTVYEVNDHYLATQPWNPIAYLSDNLLTRSLSSQLARFSDALQFTVPELEKDFGHLNARTRVFPNQMRQMPSFKQRRTGATVRLGWGGSLGHLKDLEWVMPALKSVLQAHPDVQLCIMGPEQISSLFSWVPSNRIEIRPGGSIDEYYRFVETLDIGLCPNLRTAFNRCRSDIKFLEYAAFGVVAVCSDIEPYRESVKHQENGCLFSTPGELEEVLHSLIREPERRRRLSRAAYECVAYVRTEGRHARHKLEQYQSWAAEAGKPLSTADAAQPLALECTFPDSRYVRLGEGALESVLYEGLRCAQQGHNSQAVTAFLEASRLAPDFYVPFLLAGSSESNPEKAVTYLRQAAASAPDSPHVALTLASRHEALGDWTLAQPLWERCMTIAPWLGLAQTRLGAFAEKAGDVALAVELYAQAFAQNPFFAPPVVQLAEKALAQSDFPLVENLMKAAMAGDSWLWQYPYYLGRALLAQKKSLAAAEALEQALSLSPEPRVVLPLLAKAALASGQVEKAKSILQALTSLPAR